MNPLNASQVHILQALSSAPRGLTRDGIAAAAGDGVSLSADNLGPVTDDAVDRGSNSDSLRARGLVTVHTFEDEPAVYAITAEGKKWAARSSAKSKMPDDQRIPNRVLDAAVTEVKKNKAYGLELYTAEDIEEVRLMCASHELHGKSMVDHIMDEVVARYAAITDDNVRLQMTNRRKQGAFSDPDAKVKADLKKLGALLKKFNVRIDEDSEMALDELCDSHDLPPILQMDD